MAVGRFPKHRPATDTQWVWPADLEHPRGARRRISNVLKQANDRIRYIDKCFAVASRLADVCHSPVRLPVAVTLSRDGRPAGRWQRVIGRSVRKDADNIEGVHAVGSGATRSRNRTHRCQMRPRSSAEKRWSSHVAWLPRSGGCWVGARVRACCVCCGSRCRSGNLCSEVCDAERASPPVYFPPRYFSMHSR